jgi:hypothetical protein
LTRSTTGAMTKNVRNSAMPEQHLVGRRLLRAEALAQDRQHDDDAGERGHRDQQRRHDLSAVMNSSTCRLTEYVCAALVGVGDRQQFERRLRSGQRAQQQQHERQRCIGPSASAVNHPVEPRCWSQTMHHDLRASVRASQPRGPSVAVHIAPADGRSGSSSVQMVIWPA